MALILIASFVIVWSWYCWHCLFIFIFMLYCVFFLYCGMYIIAQWGVWECIPKCNISQAIQSLIDLWFRLCFSRNWVLNTSSSGMLKVPEALFLKEKCRPTNSIHQFTNSIVFGFSYPTCLLKFTHLEFWLIGWNPVFYATKDFFSEHQTFTIYSDVVWIEPFYLKYHCMHFNILIVIVDDWKIATRPEQGVRMRSIWLLGLN